MKDEISFTASLGGKNRSFRLGHAQLYELETGAPWRDSEIDRNFALMGAKMSGSGSLACGPVAKVFARLRSGDWTLPDVTQTIRLALIGGGMSAEEAQALVATHVLDKPLAASVQLAIAAIGAALLGTKKDAA